MPDPPDRKTKTLMMADFSVYMGCMPHDKALILLMFLTHSFCYGRPSESFNDQKALRSIVDPGLNGTELHFRTDLRFD